MGVNKVKYGNNTVIDISNDTVTPSSLLEGYTAHDNTGATIAGTFSFNPDGKVYQDDNGYVVLDDDWGSQPHIKALTVDPTTSQQVFRAADGNIICEMLHESSIDTHSQNEISSGIRSDNINNKLSVNTEYHVTGNIAVIDSSNEILETRTIDKKDFVFGQTGVSYGILDSDNSKYIAYLYCSMNSNGVVIFSVRHGISGTYKFVISIQFRENVDYDGFDPVTVNAVNVSNLNCQSLTVGLDPDISKTITSNDGYQYTIRNFIKPNIVNESGYLRNYYPYLINWMESPGTSYKCHNLITDHNYHVVGTVTIFNKSVLDVININSYINNYSNSTDNVFYTGDSDSYISSLAFYHADSDYIGMRITYNKVGTYGFVFNLNVFDYNQYDCISSVTIPKSYDFGTVTNLVSRTIEYIKIPEVNINTIGAYFFAGCSSLYFLEIPSNITHIAGYAFYNCSSLQLSSLPNTILVIRDRAFYGCSNLTLTNLPSNLTTIYEYSFNGCGKMPLTSLPSGITEIAQYAFAYCYMLELSELPDSLTSISSGAFMSCERITHVKCNGAIASLGSNIFNGGSSHPMQLVSAEFPNLQITANLSTVFGTPTAANACRLLELVDLGFCPGFNSNSFANCESLETVILRKTDGVAVLSNLSVFLNTPLRGYNNKTGTVYVPQALISSYQTADNWKTLYDAGTCTFVAIEGSEYEIEEES